MRYAVRIMHHVLPLVFRVAFSTSILAVLLCLYTSPSAEAHQRLRPKAFQGTLHLTRAPRIGGDATLVLSIQSNLTEAVQAQILFRLPHGITAESPDRFDQAYFPPHDAEQQYSVRIHVDTPGNYPLQASIYVTLANGGKVVQHFYTYLSVTPSHTETASQPFDEEARRFPLQTQAQSSFHAQQDGIVTIRGSVVYFDDNERIELPVQRPRIHLYRENLFANDTEIADTFGDEHGDYGFDSLDHPALNDGNPRDLYVVVSFDNAVLSITNRFQKIYELQSDTVHDVPDGETLIDLALDSSNPNRGVGHIFNMTQAAHAFLYDRLSWERDRPIQVVWPGSLTVSYYDVTQVRGQVIGETVVIAPGEDQWQRITIFHEYGHAVMTAAYGYNHRAVPRGSYVGTHRLETVSDLGFAFNEGWAEFMEAAVDNNALNVTGFLRNDSPNIESNQWWTGHVNGTGQNVKGEVVEGTVASILWDIFDTPASIDLVPTIDDDSISDRLDLFWEIFVNETPQNITDVAMAWRSRGFPMLEELERIYANHHALSRPNTAPAFQFTSPTAGGRIADDSFQIGWEAFDLDGDDFTIDLFYDFDRIPGESARIESGVSSNLSAWNWDTGSVGEGKYYLRAIVEDSRDAQADVYSDGFVVIDRTPIYDLNEDNIVDVFDLVAVANHFGETIVELLDPNPDINRDGVVNILDLVLIAAHFGEVVP